MGIEPLPQCKPWITSPTHYPCATAPDIYNINACVSGACNPGSYFDQFQDDCKTCPFGRFQPLKWQEGCRTCRIGYITYRRGAVTEDECLCKFLYNADVCLHLSSSFYVCLSDYFLSNVTSLLFVCRLLFLQFTGRLPYWGFSIQSCGDKRQTFWQHSNL